jgi:hypothetical protein
MRLLITPRTDKGVNEGLEYAVGKRRSLVVDTVFLQILITLRRKDALAAFDRRASSFDGRLRNK